MEDKRERKGSECLEGLSGERGTIFYARYEKGVPFPSEIVYKRVKVWTSRLSLPAENFVEFSPPPLPGMEDKRERKGCKGLEG